MLISYKNTFTETSRIMLNNISGHHVPISWHIKLIIPYENIQNKKRISITLKVFVSATDHVDIVDIQNYVLLLHIKSNK